MVILEDFETLEYAHLLSISAFSWSAPLIQANFGGGYGAGVIANQDYGLHSWTIKANFLPDITFTAGEDDEFYLTYFLNFFKRHILFGNKPFILRDIRNNKYYLVAFAQGQAGFERMADKFYRGESLQATERRHPDLELNADGSLVIIDYVELFESVLEEGTLPEDFDSELVELFLAELEAGTLPEIFTSEWVELFEEILESGDLP
jgi:hypothetical protein